MTMIILAKSEKPPESSISEQIETINNSLDPDKIEEKSLKMAEMLKKLHKENEQMKRDKGKLKMC